MNMFFLNLSKSATVVDNSVPTYNQAKFKSCSIGSLAWLPAHREHHSPGTVIPEFTGSETHGRNSSKMGSMLLQVSPQLFLLLETISSQIKLKRISWKWGALSREGKAQNRMQAPRISRETWGQEQNTGKLPLDTVLPYMNFIFSLILWLLIWF